MRRFNHGTHVIAIELRDSGHYVPSERHSGRNRQPGADCRPETYGFAAERPFIVCRRERNHAGDDAVAHHHPSTTTSPVPPSTRTRAPFGMALTAPTQPTTPGRPYSRDTIAA